MWSSLPQASEICLTGPIGISASAKRVLSAFEACELHAAAWEAAFSTSAGSGMDWLGLVDLSATQVDSAIRAALVSLRADPEPGLAVLVDGAFYQDGVAHQR